MNRRAVVCGIASALLAARASRCAAASSVYLGGRGMPYDAFDALPKTVTSVGGGKINIGFAPGSIALPQQAMLNWVEKAAKAVSIYYGRFPVNSVRLLIVPVDGGGVRAGTTWGYRGAAIRMQLGRDATQNDLDHDWKMTHEFVHLALPDVDEDHSWLSEGLAVYIEPIARVQSGELTALSIWTDMLRDMPKGLPQSGDEGLDNTPTWSRIYWGGALFCLLADVQIREKTQNRLGLQDAMRGVLAAGGNHELEWPVAKILDTADRAVQLNVLSALYGRMHATPVTPDLPALWKSLGVESADGAIRLQNDAPLAAVREAITRKPTAG